MKLGLPSSQGVSIVAPARDQRWGTYWEDGVAIFRECKRQPGLFPKTKSHSTGTGHGSD